MTVFIRRTLVEDKTVSECIRIVAATYFCKISQLFEYGANEYGYKAKCYRYPKVCSHDPIFTQIQRSY